MNLTEAIALSDGNKAKAVNNQGKTVIVQERYAAKNDYWYHVWLLIKPYPLDRDIDSYSGLDDFGVDSNENYWSPI